MCIFQSANCLCAVIWVFFFFLLVFFKVSWWFIIDFSALSASHVSYFITLDLNFYSREPIFHLQKKKTGGTNAEGVAQPLLNVRRDLIRLGVSFCSPINPSSSGGLSWKTLLSQWGEALLGAETERDPAGVSILFWRAIRVANQKSSVLSFRLQKWCRFKG